MSLILRTAGIDRTSEEIEWDLTNLLAIWEAIKTVIVQKKSPFLVYKESNAVLRSLRDYLTFDIGEILIDEKSAYEDAKEFIDQVMPQNLKKLKFYDEEIPLFTNFQIESQIESAYTHSVDLPSGGSIVIDHTEALVSIDINSAKSTKGSDIEETAVATNVEAAIEIARQLRLRDLGGLVVIDFIDMHLYKNQREVENQLRKAAKNDRARIQIGKISRFGLLEMSRQRLKPALSESNQLICPRCTGIGSIRSVESLALSILRIIGEEARKDMTAKIIAQLPIDIATYLLNEKRDWVQSIESNHNTKVVLVANSSIDTPHFKVKRVRIDEVNLPENLGHSFDLTEKLDEQIIPEVNENRRVTEIPAVGNAKLPKKPPGKDKDGNSKNIWSIFKNLFESDEDNEKKSKKRKHYNNRNKRKTRSNYKDRPYNKKKNNKTDPVKTRANKTKPNKPNSPKKDLISSDEKIADNNKKQKPAQKKNQTEKEKSNLQKKKKNTTKKKEDINKKRPAKQKRRTSKDTSKTTSKTVAKKDDAKEKLMPWPIDDK